MCGRFENKRINKDVVDLFNQADLNIEIDKVIDNSGREDIRPTHKISSILMKNGNYFLTKIKWGIKYSEKSPLIFNSRIETIKEKKFWNSLFDRNRCIIPMTGFYEWKVQGTNKVKYRIFLPDHEIFFVPALYQLDKEKNICASLITTIPNKFISQIHHRMPVIFDFHEAIKFMIDDIDKNLARCLPYDNKKKMALELAE
jgi:putative SOS response-associated peptidase YedK